MSRTRNIRSDSAKAVANAGSRPRGKAVESAGAWGHRGKLPETETFRPGKTTSDRKGKVRS